MAFVTAQGNKAELPDGPHSHLPSVLRPQHKCQELGEKMEAGGHQLRDLHTNGLNYGLHSLKNHLPREGCTDPPISRLTKLKSTYTLSCRPTR